MDNRLSSGVFEKAIIVLKSKKSDLVAVSDAIEELEKLVPATRTEIKSYKVIFYQLAQGYHILGNSVKCCFYMHRALLLDPLHKPTLELFREVGVRYKNEIQEEFSMKSGDENQPKSPQTDQTAKKEEINITKEEEEELEGEVIDKNAMDFRGIPLIQTSELLQRISPTETEQILRTFRLITQGSKKKKKDKNNFSETDFIRNNPHMKYFYRFKTFRTLRSSCLFVPYFCTSLVSDLAKMSKCEVGLGKNMKTVMEKGNEKRRFVVPSFNPQIFVDQFFVANAIRSHGSVYDSINLLFESILLHQERTVNKKTYKDYIVSSICRTEELSIGFAEFDFFMTPHFKLLREMKLLPNVNCDDLKSFHRFITEKTSSLFRKLVFQHDDSVDPKEKMGLKSRKLTKVEFCSSAINFHHRFSHYNLIPDEDYVLQEERVEGNFINRSSSRIETPIFHTNTDNFKKFGRLLDYGTKEFNFGFFILYGMTLLYQKHRGCERCSTVTPEDFYDTSLVTLPVIDFDIDDLFSSKNEAKELSKSSGSSYSTSENKNNKNVKIVYPTKHDPIGGKFRTYENVIIQMKTYCFYVFKKLREIFGIDERSFFEDTFNVIKFLGSLLLLHQNKSLIFQSSMGRSGTFFFYSNDGKYLVKKLTGKEFRIFLNTLPQYYGHQKYSSMKKKFSLLSKYVFCFTLHLKSRKRDVGSIEFVEDILFRSDEHGGETYYFVVMKNVFSTQNEIHEIYDLKGSKLARSNAKGPVMKDNDLKRKLYIGNLCKSELFTILKADVRMLNFLELTDYSLLLGVNYRRGRRSTILPNQYYPKGVNQKLDLKQLSRKYKKKGKGKTKSNRNLTTTQTLLKGFIRLEDDSMENEADDNNNKKGDGLGGKRSLKEVDESEIRLLYQDELGGVEDDEEEENNMKDFVFTEDGGIMSTNSKEVYYFGIIDLLTKFTFTKYAERNLKTLRNLGNKEDISAAPHEYYSERFLYFLDNVFQ